MALPNPPSKIQRSFTLPTKLQGATTKLPNSDRNTTEDAVEVLFAHSSGRIVSFSPAIVDSPRAKESPVGATPQDDGLIGVLPWASRTERTMASGPLRVYRLPGSVAFLNSGKTLHPILKKSQCWCVDGETKFVLRIRGHNYYRIELPNTCDEDRKAAEDLGRVLAEVAQFETIACPFMRGFHVDVPEKQDTPKRPWRPKHQPITASPASFLNSSGDEASNVSSDHESNSLINTDDERAASSPHTHILEQDRYTALNHDEAHTKRMKSTEKVEAIVSAFEDMKTPPKMHVERQSRSRSRSYSISPARRFSGVITPAGSDAATSVITSKISQESLSSVHVAASSTGSHLHQPRQAVGLTRSDGAQDADSANVLHESSVPGRGTEPSLSGFERPDSTRKPTISNFNNMRDSPLNPLRYQRSVTAPLPLPVVEDETEDSRQLEMPLTAIPTVQADTSEDQTPFAPFITSVHDPVKPFEPSIPSHRDPPIQHDPEVEETVSPHTYHSLDSSDVATSASSLRSEGSPSTPHLPSPEGLTLTHKQSFYVDAQSDTEHFSSPQSSRDSSPSTYLRRRFTNRRSNSPLPPSVNLYTPRDRITSYHLTAAVLQKTCSIVLAPPARLVALMLNIARRITDGAIRGESSMNVESGRRIPCSWDSDEDFSADELCEDDFGFGLHGHEPSEKHVRGKMPASTEDDSEID